MRLLRIRHGRGAADCSRLANSPGYLAMALLVFAAVPAGFAERPAEAELIAAKTLAVWCALGVQERCLATQYANDPPAYRVAPPNFSGTNASGWPLDQTMMATLDSTIKELVPWYADTNGAALTVPGLWAEMQIGDKTNLFTRDSSVTSAVWNAEDLTERYQVLWTLRNTTSFVTRTYAERWEGSGAITNDANTPLPDGCAQAYEVAADDYRCTGYGSLIGGVWTNDATLQTAKLQQWARNTVAIGYRFPTNLVVTGGTNLVLKYTNIVVVSVSNSLPRYIDNGDGTVTDRETGLMWMKNANLAGSAMNWAAAVAYCDALETNGYSDWRLPGTELDTIGRSNGVPTNAWEGFSGAPFTSVQSDYYWSDE